MVREKAIENCKNLDNKRLSRLNDAFLVNSAFRIYFLKNNKF